MDKSDAGQAATGLKFGVRDMLPTALVSGLVFNDLDADGARGPSEPGLPNRLLYLDLDSDKKLDAAEPQLTTAADGSFTLRYRLGAYTLRLAPTPNWTQTTPADGLTITLGSLPAGCLALFGSSNDSPAAPTSQISGIVFSDLDADRARDSRDPALPARQVFLDTNANGRRDAGETLATTDAAGAFRFSNLAPGTYRLAQILPAGWRATTPKAGYLSISLAAGAAATGLAFGQTNTIILTGTLFADTNRNGLRNAGERALFNWRVFIDADRDGRLDPTEPSVLTNSRGVYTFRALPPGKQTIRVIRQAGWKLTAPIAGYRRLSVAGGATAKALDFGFRKA